MSQMPLIGHIDSKCGVSRSTSRVTTEATSYYNSLPEHVQLCFFVYNDTMSDMKLVEEWKTLYSKTLPALARAKDPAQPRWPVTLDHCFARIILDNTIGQGSKQWDKVIQKPAVKHMSDQQLRNAIELGQKIRAGSMDLCELDQISLMCRGKNEAKYASSEKPTITKRRNSYEDVREKKPKTDTQSTLSFNPSQSNGTKKSTKPVGGRPEPDFDDTLKQIRDHPKLTPYRRRLYTILLSVPQGRYTTYAAMSDYLNSSARAVGNGMRNNPFAPDVPCHRVLAADGSLGGFKGDWGVDGKYGNDKLKLLREEGIRFDGKGKVVGEPFRKFHEFEQTA
jgi:O-6-methylguanine DNA methyltransferase